MKRIFTITLSLLLFISIFETNSQAPVRKVLIEEFTTASCGNCPMMSAFIGSWHEAHASNSILYSIHEGSGNDAMSNSTTRDIFNAMKPSWGWFAPAVMIDRGIYPPADSEAYMKCYKSWGSAPTPGIDSIAERLMSEAAKVGLDISGSYNSSTRTINATVNVKFVESVPQGDWRISLMMIEDSVIGYPKLGPFKGWDQNCYDGQWAETNYPGMFDGKAIIGYPHRHVLRAALLGSWGKEGVIPPIPTIGQIYSTTTSIVVDTAFNPGRLTLVAFVSSFGEEKKDKFILNANEIKVSDDFATAIEHEEMNQECQIINIYPNPANHQVSLQFSSPLKGETISIFNSLGIEIMRFDENCLSGTNSLNINTDSLPSGIYYCALNSGFRKACASFRVVK